MVVSVWRDLECEFKVLAGLLRVVVYTTRMASEEGGGVRQADPGARPPFILYYHYISLQRQDLWSELLDYQTINQTYHWRCQKGYFTCFDDVVLNFLINRNR